MIEIPKTVIALDFETYYAADYSLRQKDVSQTEYIRDPRFKAHGVSIRLNNEPKAQWYETSELQDVLNSFDWKNSALLAHHTHFDGLILSHHFGIVPAYYMCTLSMARPLHGGHIGNDLDSLSVYYGGKGKKADILPLTKGIRDLPPDLMQKLALYGCQDTDVMCHIFNQMLPHYSLKELSLIHYTIKAYADPVLKVDIDLATKVHESEIENKKKLLEKLEITDKKQLTSREKFASRLRALDVEPPKKISPATNKPTYAFSKDDITFQALQDHPDERVRDLIEARLICQSAMEETRAKRLISHSNPALPIYLAYGKAHTFRWAGGDKMNPQNFGRNSDLRTAIIAPPGHDLVVVDSGQIEARVNAWLAEETELVEAFRDGDDIYSVFAGEEVYFIPVDEVTKQQRFVGKTCILGLGYQMGAPKFQYTLESGKMGPKVHLEDEGKYADTVQRYRRRFPNIRNQWYYFNDRLHDMWKGKEIEYGPITFIKEGVTLPNGMTLRYPNLRPEWNEDRGIYDNFKYNKNSHIYGGLLVENVVQALARIVVAGQILRVAHKYRTVLLVHDEVVLCTPKEKSQQALEETLESFGQPLDWCKDLPVVGEGEISPCYLKM